VNDESVDAIDERGSDIMLGTLLEGTLRYDDARLLMVDVDIMEDLSGTRMPSAYG
jgi:hypothetical protein